jgi:hypothetical protein
MTEIVLILHGIDFFNFNTLLFYLFIYFKDIICYEEPLGIGRLK